MNPWSRYNTLFRSERYGWFLHNTLSAVMLELDERHHAMAVALEEGAAGAGAADEGFTALLEEHGFLANPETEKLKLMELRYRRNAACFGTGYVGLTICPTLACNFSCPYCFEHSQTDMAMMDQKTIEALLQFINSHKEARHLSVSWYGGEPTLAFGVIERLTEAFIALFPDYADAGMVTNGYLLDRAKIERLNDLRITTVQITLDGSRAVHDRRRTLRGGGPTYERILENVDSLMASDWKGQCSIRVNVDNTNRDEYTALHHELLERYKGKKLLVYPGHVNRFEGEGLTKTTELRTAEWSGFQLDCYRRDGITPRGGFYPTGGAHNTCIATSHQGYVVGPKGELYKCWEDVGKERMVVGSVHEEPFITNPELLTRYTIGTDPHSDPNCLECKVFPVCGGGCVNKRMRAQQFGEGGITYCSPLKESLEAYLDAYMDVWHTNQICSAVLGKGEAPSMEKGYRMVQPERKQEDEETKNPLERLATQE
ncbi:radical SAM protein [Chlorobium sp. N1]|uniref:radical SAM/SPASM domain-containing protein n=1 Tax=Chlorobium sp. N1 TaxID=2491138 RepID=UPI00103DDAF3|nr:radical SAM protein [Chlorobium sp. N1]TCD47944.1 radical SAM protein [Chlorobium sp. N1]